MVIKTFEKLENNRLADNFEKYDLSSDFQCGFRSSRSTADLLTVKSDRIAVGFNRHEATLYPRFLTGFGKVLFTNSSVMELQVGYLALFRLFSVINRFCGSGCKVFSRISN